METMETTVQGLEAKKELLVEASNQAYDALELTYIQLFKKHFGSALHENDIIEPSIINYSVRRRIYYRVNRFKEDNNYPTEIFSVSIEEKDPAAEEDLLQVNYYTCGSTGSPFEMERLMSLGKVAEIINTRSEDIINDWRDLLNSEIVITYRSLNRELNEINREITALKEANLNETKEAALEAFYNTGRIEFKEPVVISREFDNRVYTQVEGFTVTKVNPKTVDLVIIKSGYNDNKTLINKRVNKANLKYVIGRQAIKNNIL